jgi:membrane fusion protein (multidrug efflux system)
MRTRIVAPVTGTVTRRSVQLGERINPGAALMTVVPLNALWVNANLKESQLQHVRLGQSVSLSSDLYGSGVSYRGTVIGFDAGTGSAFSVLPAQNATGNWIKVTQRVPVRIALDPAEVERHPLRLGLSMHVAIQSGQEVAADKPAPAHDLYTTKVFDNELHDADALVESVIRQNGGGIEVAAAKTAAHGRT